MTNWYDNIPFPVDADGRVVPLDTKVLYDANGNKVDITSFTFRCDAHGCWAYWEVFSPDVRGEDGMLYVDGLHLAPPDSWERLERDTAKDPCGYFDKKRDGGDRCLGCPAYESEACATVMAKDVIRRAKALAGVGRDV